MGTKMKLIIILSMFFWDVNMCFGNEIRSGLYNRVDTSNMKVSPYYWCLVCNDTIWITSFAGEINTYHIEKGLLDMGIISFSKVSIYPDSIGKFYWMKTIVADGDEGCVLYNQSINRKVEYGYDSITNTFELRHQVKIYSPRIWTFWGKSLMGIGFIRNLKRAKYKDIIRRDVYWTVDDSTLENNKVIKQIFSTFCGYQSNDSTCVYR